MVKQLANRYWWLLPIVVLVASALVAVQVMRPDAGPAQAALVDCATERPDDYDCWRDRLRYLVAEESPQAALDDARQAYETVPFVTSQCHQIVHEIGRAAGERYGDVAEAYAQGDDLCWSGYYHGVMEAVSQQLGLESIVAQINDICASVKEEGPYGFNHYNCVHGLGHGLMAVTNIELYESLTSCDSYEDYWERESCYGGVFMENVMAKSNPHHTTQYLRDDDPLYPCTAVDDPYAQQCYLMQTSHALTVVGYDYAAVFDLCLTDVDPAYQATCLQSLGRDVSGQTISQAEPTIQLCMLGENDFARENCFIGAAKDYVSYYNGDTEALAMCAAIEDTDLSALCTDTVVTFYAGL